MDWIGRWQRWKLGQLGVSLAHSVVLAGRSYLAGCTELVFPPVCLACGDYLPAHPDRICAQCQSGWMGDVLIRCRQCAKPLPQHARPEEGGCPACRSKSWRVQRTIALGNYGGTLRELILKIKQPRHESLCLAAGTLLATRIQRQLADDMPNLLASVPMHWLRRLSRGINDSELLCEAVADSLSLPWDSRLLRSRRPTRKQGTLFPAQRKRNVRGAYGVRRRAPLDGRHVLLVDDVMTTGATANELAKVLRRAGAARVSVAVIARGVGFD